eukprot:GHUV01024581.1.p1 GENE.GHUV01024581.1~~GHUV01024581.1.p1  ORF type:complete len:111 (-),score=12.30 GHUV01024581.1:977-1309(-)
MPHPFPSHFRLLTCPYKSSNSSRPGAGFGTWWGATAAAPGLPFASGAAGRCTGSSTALVPYNSANSSSSMPNTTPKPIFDVIKAWLSRYGKPVGCMHTVRAASTTFKLQS